MPIKYRSGAGSGGGAPSGAAGGVLGGTYPNPSFAADMATQAELDAVTATEGASFPVSPVAGQMFCLLVDDTNGVEWFFRRNVANTKWRFIGGASLFDQVNASETTTSTTYIALTTAGPAITLPVAGLYEFDFGCFIGNSAAFTARMGISLDGATPVASTQENACTGVAGTANARWNGAKKFRASIATPATAVTALYNVSNAGNTGTFDRRWLAIRPVQTAA